MPRCPACSTPITVTEILCRRCFYEDDRPLMPRCQRCGWNEACGESWYQICSPCLFLQRLREYDAAIPIQTAARGYIARQLLKKHKAARCLQAIWRGYLTRSQLALQ